MVVKQNLTISATICTDVISALYPQSQVGPGSTANLVCARNGFRSSRLSVKAAPLLSAMLGPCPLILGSGLALPCPPAMYPSNQLCSGYLSPISQFSKGPPSCSHWREQGCVTSCQDPWMLSCLPACPLLYAAARLPEQSSTLFGASHYSPLQTLCVPPFCLEPPPPPVTACVDRLSARPGTEIPPEHLSSLPPPQHLDVHCQNTPHMLAFSGLLCVLD